MPTTTPDRRFSAPSGFDTDDTQFIDRDSEPTTDPVPTQLPDQGSVPGTGEQAPLSEDEVRERDAYEALDHELITKYDQAAAEKLSDILYDLPDVSDNIVETMEKVSKDRAASPAVTPRLHEKNLMILGYHEAVLAREWYKLRDIDLSVNDDPLGKIRQIETVIDDEIAGATDDKVEELQAQKQQVESILKHAEMSDELSEMRQSAAGNYYTVAHELSGKKPTDEQAEQLLGARKSVKKLIDIDKEEIKALDVVNQYLPRVIEDYPDEDEEELKGELTAAQERMDKARTRLAELHAKRQKKIFGFDRTNQDELDEIKGEYNAAVRALIAKEIEIKVAAEGLFQTEAAANEFVATRTVDEAMALDKETIENYGKNNGKLSKAINWIAGRTPDGEKDDRFRAKIRRGTLKFVIPVSFLGLSIVTGGAAAVALGSGAYATTKLYAHFETAGRDRRMKKQPGLLNKEAVIANLEAAAEDDDEDKYDIAIASQMIEDAAEDETKKQRFHATKRLVGAIALGAGAAAGSRMVGHWINPDGPAVAHEGGGSAPDAQVPGEKPPITVTPDAPTPDIPVPGHEFAPGTFYAHNGDGFYDILKNMGVEASQRDDVLARASKELFKQGYAYRMEDGLPGIPRPGSLSQGAIDILVKAAGK